jgi:hypothetical protein
VDLARVVKPQSGSDPAARVEFLVKLLLDGEISGESRKHLEDFAKKSMADHKDEPQWLAELVHTILTMPEYQLA